MSTPDQFVTPYTATALTLKEQADEIERLRKRVLELETVLRRIATIAPGAYEAGIARSALAGKP